MLTFPFRKGFCPGNNFHISTQNDFIKKGGFSYAVPWDVTVPCYVQPGLAELVATQ